MLSERAISVKQINANEIEKGITNSEVKLLRLVQKMTNGTKVEISKDGTELKFYPGIINNNEGVKISFDCGTDRSIGYFLEMVILIAIFGKHDLDLQLKGITNDHIDISVDNLISTATQLIKAFNPDVKFISKIVARQFRPINNNNNNSINNNNE
jgi:RNA 3'-terminal phosphate cyclase-like protein